MDLYRRVSYQAAKLLTENYSTSFSASCRLFDASLRQDIYAIYGLVRIADEIVDTYRGSDASVILDELEAEVYASIDRQYSANPIVMAFAETACRYGIDQSLVQPFFESMRIDSRASYEESMYESYIYGSASVVGLMCLKVFVSSDDNRYNALQPTAKALGSAFQKVNFLRDIQSDHDELGRLYFPGVDYATMSSDDKQAIEADIRNDFQVAAKGIDELPASCRAAVRLSYDYYHRLLEIITHSSVADLKRARIRVDDFTKIRLFGVAYIRKVTRAR